MPDCTIPSLLEYKYFDGDIKKYEEAVYAAYQSEFAEQEYLFRGVRIAHKKHPEYKNRSYTFWHIISSGDDEASRSPDIRRYERIRWPSHIMKHCIDNCGELLIWENKRGSDHRILMWCPSIEYLLVFAKRTGYIIFWTAYPVSDAHTKKKLRNEYTEYMAKTAQP